MFNKSHVVVRKIVIRQRKVNKSEIIRLVLSELNCIDLVRGSKKAMPLAFYAPARNNKTRLRGLAFLRRVRDSNLSFLLSNSKAFAGGILSGIRIGNCANQPYRLTFCHLSNRNISGRNDSGPSICRNQLPNVRFSVLNVC
jgi:hypothetical protein